VYCRARISAIAIPTIASAAPTASRTSQAALATTCRLIAKKIASVTMSQMRSSTTLPNARPPDIGASRLSQPARRTSPMRTGSTLLQASPPTSIA
jgi:hypothetical protein